MQLRAWSFYRSGDRPRAAALFRALDDQTSTADTQQGLSDATKP